MYIGEKMNKEILDLISNYNEYLNEREYNRLVELSEIEKNWDGKNADPMNYKSLEKALIFIKQNKNIERNLYIFFGYEGELILEWKDINITNILIFEKNMTTYYNDFISYDIVISDYVLSKIRFNNKFEFYNDKELHKLSLLYDLKYCSKRTIDSLIEVALSENDYDIYASTYEVNFKVLENLVKFLNQIYLEDVYFTVVPDGNIEGYYKKEDIDIELDIDLEKIAIYKTPFSDENTIVIEISNIYKFKNINEIIEEINYEK
jgi:hypothetical protein